MHPLAAPVRAWKLTTANTSMMATTAARTQIGAPLLVSPIRPLDPESGSSGQHHFALKTAVAARVSNVETIVENVPFVEFNLTDCLQQVLSPLQTTPKVILTTWRGQRRYK